jgi:hypothetical protein
VCWRQERDRPRRVARPDVPAHSRADAEHPARRMLAPQPPGTVQVLTSGTGQHPRVAMSPPIAASRIRRPGGLGSLRRDSNPRPSDYEATGSREVRIGWLRLRSSGRVPGNLEPCCASQNIGHVIGQGRRPAVTIRPLAPSWPSHKESDGKASDTSTIRSQSDARGWSPGRLPPTCFTAAPSSATFIER